MVSSDALTDRERQVLAVFATFPAWTIPVRDALTLLRDFGTEDEVLSALETAADYGLLTSNWRGYAMHPVLAESFRPLLPPMEKVPRLGGVRGVQRALPRDRLSDGAADVAGAVRNFRLR